MKPLLSTLAALLLLTPLRAQQTQQADSTAYTLSIGQVSVTARRALSQIGIQRTEIDTVALRTSLSASLADVLMNNTSIFVKSYGRASLATVSFRGTAPSHTQVTWNGLRLNSPMLGMVDFSLIPSYLVDGAGLLHGASSVGTGSGGFGGTVQLTTTEPGPGVGLKYIQGFGSFGSFDEFLHLSYGGTGWSSSTRLVCSSSDNDFRYRNYDKKLYHYDPQGNITGWEYPLTLNRNGDFRDLHLLQEFRLHSGANRYSLSAWYLDSRRGLPSIKTDTRDEDRARARQRESTLRAIAGWERLSGALRLSASAGYTYSNIRYLYQGDNGTETLVDMADARSRLHTFTLRAGAQWYIGRKWQLSADLSATQHKLTSVDHRAHEEPNRPERFELSGLVALRWRPTDRLGLALDLREEIYRGEATPLIPAGFVEYTLSRRGSVVLKFSAARNYRYPTLNDLYFIPGGNPLLRPEKGFTYDGGISFALSGEHLRLSGEATLYDSYIDDWILWLQNERGYASPVNVKQVHSYGAELKGRFDWNAGRDWAITLTGNFAWTPSINRGDRESWADASIGRQLVYIPARSASVNGRLGWRRWTLSYLWCYYGERYTTSDNKASEGFNRIAPYYMSDLSLEKSFAFRRVDLSVKGIVHNLFDEEYESVLARPMPRMNWQLFIEIRPRFNGSARHR